MPRTCCRDSRSPSGFARRTTTGGLDRFGYAESFAFRRYAAKPPFLVRRPKPNGLLVTGTLRVTVCGSSSSIPRPGRACSSYLIEGDGTAVVADLGSGSLANVLRSRPAESLDAVVISHMHADHFLDVVPLRYALKYGPRTNARRVLLYLPPDGEAMLRRLVAAFDGESGADFLGEVYDVRTYDPRERLQIGAAAFRFAAARHFVPTFAIRVQIGTATIAYSSDTAPAEGVVELARGASAFLCEATLGADEADQQPRGHSSALEAGGMAARAQAERLVLTHYAVSVTPAAIARAAAAAYTGRIDVADDGDVVML